MVVVVVVVTALFALAWRKWGHWHFTLGPSNAGWRCTACARRFALGARERGGWVYDAFAVSAEAISSGAGGGWDLRDLGAAHLHGSAHLAVRTREGDVGGGVGAGDVIVVRGYGAEEGAVLEQAVGIRVEVQSASTSALLVRGGRGGQMEG